MILLENDGNYTLEIDFDELLTIHYALCDLAVTKSKLSEKDQAKSEMLTCMIKILEVAI